MISFCTDLSGFFKLLSLKLLIKHYPPNQVNVSSSSSAVKVWCSISLKNSPNFILKELSGNHNASVGVGSAATETQLLPLV